jgi:hypothetical protein
VSERIFVSNSAAVGSRWDLREKTENKTASVNGSKDKESENIRWKVER